LEQRDKAFTRDDLRSAPVLDGGIVESDFTAEIAQVLRGDAHGIYGEASESFANSHARPAQPPLERAPDSAGRRGEVAFVRSERNGGGEPHGLMTLAHTAEGMPPRTESGIHRAAAQVGSITRLTDDSQQNAI